MCIPSFFSTSDAAYVCLRGIAFSPVPFTQVDSYHRGLFEPSNLFGTEQQTHFSNARDFTSISITGCSPTWDRVAWRPDHTFPPAATLFLQQSVPVTMRSSPPPTLSALPPLDTSPPVSPSLIGLTQLYFGAPAPVQGQQHLPLHDRTGCAEESPSELTEDDGDPPQRQEGPMPSAALRE